MTTRSLLALIALGGFALSSPAPAHAAAQSVVPHGVPDEFASLAYAVTVNGTPVKVFHAGLNVHFASFDFTGAAEVKVAALPSRGAPPVVRPYSGQYRHRLIPPASDDFWQSQAVVRPLSRQVAVTTRGREAHFTLSVPGQYSVERPGTSHYLDQVLLLFAFFVPPELQDANAVGRPAAEVKDILIANCVLWSTLANVYRIGFGAQRLRTENIQMRQCDVIHLAQGEWHAPWSIVHTMTAGAHGQSEHSGYLFEDVRLEEATAFLGIQNEQATFRDVVFRRVSMQGTPPPSLIRGPFQGLTFDGVTVNGRPIRSAADLPLREGSRPVAGLVFR